ncbi:hypothetical protein [uncultured Mucilaginibacter sp.]|uniref:hypothetical protein n=1 Tax=uncultured Mucilaginibacter sp. TaxID=797541 RepID=UPI0025E8718D|nr:hypothetical protein [uncultured Mucilaginibacter sp.]
MVCNKVLKTSLLFVAILLICESFVQAPSIIEKVRQANRIEIHFLRGKQPCVYKSSKKIDLTYLKDLIIKAKSKHDLQCDTTGIILYFRNKVELAKVYFSSRGTGSKYKYIDAVVFNSNNKNILSQLNYGTGMLLDDVFYNLQKRK